MGNYKELKSLKQRHKGKKTNKSQWHRPDSQQEYKRKNFQAEVKTQPYRCKKHAAHKIDKILREKHKVYSDQNNNYPEQSLKKKKEHMKHHI